MSSQPPEIRVIISGGGTGGHIFPALAVAGALKSMNKNTKILFVGARGRMEMEKVPAAGYEIIGLNISGFNRSSVLSNIKVPFRLFSSLLKAGSVIRKFRPDVVVGVGGYASGPVLFMATLMKIPSLIQEQNSYAGITNKILGKRVQRICVAYDNMEKYFPADKLVLTGNPVRKEILSGKEKRAEAIKWFSLDSQHRTVLVIGGSLGARTINKSIMAGWKQLCDKGLQVIWQTGKQFFKTAEGIEKESGGMVKVHEFISRMDLAYSAADLIVSRAGASSISELAIAAKPVILIPSPNVAEDHQTKNAMALVEKNAALIIRDDQSEESLTDSIIDLANDENTRRRLISGIEKLAIHDADVKIANEVRRLAGK